MPKRIRFTFKKNGTIDTDAEGFQGTGCVETTQRLMDALLAKAVDFKPKQEYYANENETCVGN
jgi:hypothetical protein